MMYRKLTVLVLAFVLFAIAGCSSTFTGRDEKARAGLAPGKPKTRLLIGGSGSNLSLMEKIAGKYMAQNPGTEIVIPSSIGTGGGIKKTAEGVINIGLVSRDTNKDEEKYRLTRIPYARVAIVMAVHPGVNVTGLTSEQITAIYSGKIRSWRQVGGDDRQIKVLTRETGDSTRIIFNKYIKGFATLQEPSGAVRLRTDQAMNEAIQSVPDSIGWTDLGVIRTERLNVKPVALDGLLPTENVIQSGGYPYIKELAFVVKGAPAGEVKKFIDFVNSWEGKKIIIENGYLPFK